jgi:hypothetical protein
METGGGTERLQAECVVFCQHVIGGRPDAAVLDCYTAAHESRADLFTASDRFESALLRFASRGAGRARLADAYCSFFAPGSVLRRKLALLTAILESTGSTFEVFEKPTVRSRGGWWLALAWKGTAFVFALLAGAVVLGPRHLLLSSRGESRDSATPSKALG